LATDTNEASVLTLIIYTVFEKMRVATQKRRPKQSRFVDFEKKRKNVKKT